MSHARISGVGSYLPEKILTNADLEKMVETTDEWILKRVGIRQRHIVADSGDTTSSMAEAAARKAIAHAGLLPSDIDCILVGTASPDCYFPSTACDLQERLGIQNDGPAMDINAACAGFVYGLQMAEQYIRTDTYRHILVVGVDTLSTLVDWSDRSSCILFGDGAGAIVLSASDSPGILATHIHANGQYRDLLYAKNALYTRQGVNHIHMEGNDVFRVAVTKLGEIVEQTLEKAGVSHHELDWLIPHQANTRIIKAVAKKLSMPMEKVVLTIEEHGNTSAASIPLALDHAVQSGQVRRGQKLLLEAFGAGFAWGSALVVF